MENIIIDELTKKKLSTWKRLLILVVDTIIVTAFFILLFLILGTLLIKATAKDAIKNLNEIYIEECVKQSVPYKDGLYGISQLDKDSYLTILTDNGMDFNDAMTEYNNKYYDIDTAIQSYSNYSTYYSNFSKSYYLVLLISMFIPCFIFLLVIPLTNKNNKTIMMFLTKTSLVDDKTNIICKNYKVLVRFLTIYGIEIALGYAVISWLGLGLLFIINIISVSFTKKKKTLHDLINLCHVEKDEFTYTE